MFQSRHIYAALHAVALNICIDDECSAIGQQAGQNPVNGQAGVGNPATCLEFAAFRIQRYANAVRKGAAHLGKKFGLFQSQCADNQP